MPELKDFFDFKSKNIEEDTYEETRYLPSSREILQTIIDSSFGPKGSAKLIEKTGTKNSWSNNVTEISNINGKFYDNETFELTYHCLETGYRDDPSMRSTMTEKASKFLTECEKLIKKEYKELSGLTLKWKKVKKEDDHDLEQVTFGMPWVSFIGNYPRSQPERYYLVTRRLFKLDNEKK